MRLTPYLRNLSTKIDYFSKFTPSSLTIKTLIDFGMNSITLAFVLTYRSFIGINGDINQSYQFLRVELPVRWSHMLKEMDHLPPKLLEMPSFKLVKSWFHQSFQDILNFENVDPNFNTLRKFTEALLTIRQRHVDVVPTMAQGYIELEKTRQVNLYEKNQIQYFYDRFFMNRIGIRMLIYQHTLLFGDEVPEHPQQAGIIDPNCDVVKIAKNAYDNAKFLCDQVYMQSPELEIICHNAKDHDDVPIKIVYIPSHLYHILFELLKNSMRAVVEHHDKNGVKCAPLQLLIVKGAEDITIQLRDQGGGISRSNIAHLFHYMYTTAPKTIISKSSNAQSTPMAGLGYGLPISRLYARYFHGNLVISSIEGYGTYAYVYLKLTAEQELLCLIVNANSVCNALKSIFVKMRLTRFLFQQQPLLAALVDHYAQYAPSSLTLKRIIEFAREGDAKQSYLFLRNELPVRLASMMKEMMHLPPRLLEMPSVRVVKGWYDSSLTDVHNFKDLASSDDVVQKFTETLQNIRKRHTTVVETLAQGYMEFFDAGPVQEYEESQIQYFLNRFYLSRISIRLLIYQHTMCFGDEVPLHPTHVGFIDPNCHVYSIVMDAFENAKFLCDGYYLKAPEISLKLVNASQPNEPIQIPYVPSHLYHIMFELFKNSMRATVELSEKLKSDDPLPPVQVHVVKAKEDLTIRISDRGGGIPRSKADKIFRYMYSTAPRPVSLTDSQHSGPVPLAGFGYGLPISRL
ncbi:unnamed protein product [Didymodactylos carnosus]|uniref:Protein-serine/threonine kinase n=1 Tax=Didymodactylos carnosus TaxID=1234261 RepID=A0A813U7D1_9BILA|nr:unnamed protein product [Didymodactylos carnosus]CAF0818789.1 unnamed protein product [Didymodactylos carnosus]CAF3567621.1 unnamed protein product [Didymodactylos carnosus]CAF3605093.1 unnamed protein product [Didymodactylos carnosus]